MSKQPGLIESLLRKPAAAPDTTIPIPLPGGERWAVVTLPMPMSEAEWTYLLAVLEAMKPGFVSDQAEDSAP